MGILKKGDKRYKDSGYLLQKAEEWRKSGKNVPANLPQDFEIKDADGKVKVRLMRGKPPEFLDAAGKPVDATTSDIDKAMAGMKSVVWTPPPVEFTPPSKTGPVGVGPAVPLPAVANKAMFKAVGTIENLLKPPPDSRVDISDETTGDLANLLAVAYPNVVVSPKISFWIAIGAWQAPYWELLACRAS